MRAIAVPPPVPHAQTFKAACILIKGFDLPPAVAFFILRDEFNPRCVPPWAAAELEHKIDGALKAADLKPRGYLLESRSRTA